jgi:hypothetical protein
LAYRLKRPWSNSATHVIFDPLELLEKLAALVPPPRFHMVRYHGVLAPAAKWRSQIVPPRPTAASAQAPAVIFGTTAPRSGPGPGTIPGHS